MNFLNPMVRITSFIEFIEKNPDDNLISIAQISPYTLYYICMGYAIEKQLEKEGKKDLAKLK